MSSKRPRTNGSIHPSDLEMLVASQVSLKQNSINDKLAKEYRERVKLYVARWFSFHTMGETIS